MNKSLLICICCHYSPERIQFLIQVINNFRDNYKMPFDIIIDTNVDVDKLESEDIGIYNNQKVYSHTKLEHPFHLTWTHRQHIKDNIGNYDNFMYVEDDILLPYENYLNYLENFKLLWPAFVPSFIRVEREEFVADIHEKQKLENIFIGGKDFALLRPLINYHGFWIMPQKELKETMKDDFVKLSDGREFAASYVAWTLGKQTLVEIEDNKISKKCWSYHLPNNAPNVNLKVEEIFI